MYYIMPGYNLKRDGARADSENNISKEHATPPPLYKDKVTRQSLGTFFIMKYARGACYAGEIIR